MYQDSNDKKVKKNFYAVAIGQKPGIYKQWSGENGAQAQVVGFTNARYRGFVTHKEAQDWLAELNTTGTTSPSATPKKKAASKKEKTTKGADHAALVEQALATGKVVMYTDGGCINNPGPGGFGTVLLFGSKRKELSTGYCLTTNNRMELMACIEGLNALKKPCEVLLFTDSQYVVNGITKGWAKRWRQKGWRRKGDLPAENADLWEKILLLCDNHKIEWVWVKGHAGNEGNERCDALATESSGNKNNQIHDTAYESGHTTKV